MRHLSIQGGNSQVTIFVHRIESRSLSHNNLPVIVGLRYKYRSELNLGSGG
jgi:hypothetical protein